MRLLEDLQFQTKEIARAGSAVCSPIPSSDISLISPDNPVHRLRRRQIRHRPPRHHPRDPPPRLCRHPRRPPAVHSPRPQGPSPAVHCRQQTQHQGLPRRRPRSLRALLVPLASRRPRPLKHAHHPTLPPIPLALIGSYHRAQHPHAPHLRGPHPHSQPGRRQIRAWPARRRRVPRALGRSRVPRRVRAYPRWGLGILRPVRCGAPRRREHGSIQRPRRMRHVPDVSRLDGPLLDRPRRRNPQTLPPR